MEQGLVPVTTAGFGYLGVHIVIYPSNADRSLGHHLELESIIHQLYQVEQHKDYHVLAAKPHYRHLVHYVIADHRV